MIAAGIGLDHAGINREAFAFDQAGCHAGRNDTLEYMTQDIALPEAMQPVLRERRVVRDLVVKVEPAEPAIRQMKLDLLGQLALRAQAVAITNNQHPDHQRRIDRRPPITL